MKCSWENMHTSRADLEMNWYLLPSVIPQQHEPKINKGWHFQWRRCPLKLRICRSGSLPVPERMPDTCGSSEVSRQASELIWRFSCSRPPDPEIVDNCSAWARSDLIITGYWSKMPMMRIVPGFRSKTEIWRPSDWLGLSGWKPLLRLHMYPCNNLYCILDNCQWM